MMHPMKAPAIPSHTSGLGRSFRKPIAKRVAKAGIVARKDVSKLIGSSNTARETAKPANPSITDRLTVWRLKTNLNLPDIAKDMTMIKITVVTDLMLTAIVLGKPSASFRLTLPATPQKIEIRARACH